LHERSNLTSCRILRAFYALASSAAN
jgi:hypothetical protein